MEILGYILIIVALILALVFVNKFIKKQQDGVAIDEFLNVCLENGYEVTETNDPKYNYILEDNDKIVYIKLIKVQKSSSITINSKTTWVLRFGKRSQGKAYPNLKYLQDVISFTNYKPVNAKKKTIKLVLVYPQTDIILRYVNENEIIEVKPCEVIYDYMVMRFDQFKENINNIK